MKEYVLFTREQDGGTQELYRFPNGYGASVIQTNYSYGGDDGLWEVAVVNFMGDVWELCYDTPITSDVIGYLTWVDMRKVLQQIKDLK